MSKNLSDDMPVVDSWSMGTSSTWSIMAKIMGLMPRPKHYAVVLAHTGDEHVWSYEYAEFFKGILRNEGITLLECQASETLSGHLIAVKQEGRTRAENPALWIAKDGGGVGQSPQKCTRHFKVRPMRRAVSQWLKSLGLKKRVVKHIGFAADELSRAVRADAKAQKEGVRWEMLDYPAIKLGRKRPQQRAELERWTGHKAPLFSACVYCPHNDDERWKQTAAVDLPKVYEVDEAIRDMSQAGLDEGKAYLTNHVIPIERLIRKGPPQQTLPGFDTATLGCDGGHCFL